MNLAPVSCATVRSVGLSDGSISSHAFLVMMVAPTTGANLMSIMFGARPNHWLASAAVAGAGNASIMPVCRLVRMSVGESGTIWNPASLYISSDWEFPAQTNICSFCSALSVGIGSLAKYLTQPASPQLRTTKPLSASAFSRRPLSFPRT